MIIYNASGHKIEIADLLVRNAQGNSYGLVLGTAASATVFDEDAEKSTALATLIAAGTITVTNELTEPNELHHGEEIATIHDYSATLASTRALTDYFNGQILNIGTLGLFKFDSTSTSADNATTIICPTGITHPAPGRWLILAPTDTAIVHTTGTESIAGAKTFTTSVALADDVALSLGTTLTNAATKVTLEFDKTTAGIGQFIMGDSSNPQVLNVNPGAAVFGSTINILHSAGSGNCDDLIGSYCKVAISGAGDSGLTAVGSAPRAYLLAGTAAQVYGCQPWAKHSGTGTVTAMSALSAALLINDAEAFTATNSINAGHFHVYTPGGAANGAITSTNFDGVMIEVYQAVLGLRSALQIAIETATGITNMIGAVGVATNGINFTGATLTKEIILSAGVYVTSTATTVVLHAGAKTATFDLTAGTLAFA